MSPGSVGRGRLTKGRVRCGALAEKLGAAAAGEKALVTGRRLAETRSLAAQALLRFRLEVVEDGVALVRRPPKGIGVAAAHHPESGVQIGDRALEAGDLAMRPGESLAVQA